MWTYERRLEYPVKIKKCDARAAKIIMTQYGGPYCKRYDSSRNFGILFILTIL